MYKQHYSLFMDEMLKDGDVELATDKPEPDKVCYIPHHGVFPTPKSDRLRIVYDRSAKYGVSSLHDFLLSRRPYQYSPWSDV